MPVGGPARCDSALLHDGQAMGVGQSQLLMGEFLDHYATLSDLSGVERLDQERRQVRYEREKLNRTMIIIPAPKPTVPFGDDQARCDQSRWGGEQPPEQGMATIRPVQEGDERGGVDVALSPSCHRRGHRRTDWTGDRCSRRSPHTASRVRRLGGEASGERRGGRTRLRICPGRELPSWRGCTRVLQSSLWGGSCYH